MSDLPAEIPRWSATPLTSEHLTGFLDSGRSAIDGWLHDHAMRLQDEGTCRTYVWADQAPYVAGFYTLAPHRLESDEDLRVSGHAGGALSGYLIAKLGIHQRAYSTELALPGQPADRMLEARYLLVVDAVVRASQASFTAGGKYIFVDIANEPPYLIEAFDRIGFTSISADGSTMLIMKVRRPSPAS